jgi:CRAL/TRIO domain
LQVFLEIFQSCYPERLGAAYIINQPWIFSTLWRMIKPLLDPGTVSKIVFCKSVDEVYEENGGTLFRENFPTDLNGTSAFKTAEWVDNVIGILRQEDFSSEMERRRNGNFSTPALPYPVDIDESSDESDVDGDEEDSGRMKERQSAKRRQRSGRTGPARSAAARSRRRRLREVREVHAPRHELPPQIERPRKADQSFFEWVSENPISLALILTCLWLFWNYWDLHARVRVLELSSNLYQQRE